MPRKVFSAGETLLASDVNTYLADQSVMVFDDAAARTTAIPSPIEGMVTYVKDLDLVQVWDGSEWDEVSGGGSITVSSTAPGDPEDGDLWFDDVSGSTFVYYTDSDSSQWVEVGAGSGPTAAAVASSAPASAEQGQLWFDSESGNLYFYYVDADGGQWVQVRSAAPVESLPANAYAFVETVYFTSNGTFSKGDYPWLRAIRVKAVGGGAGGGGAAATGAGESSCGGTGGGGAYSEKFIADIASLSASETITCGASGSGGAAGKNAGSGGGNSSAFGLTSDGGDGGAGGSNSSPYSGSRGFGGAASGGDLNIPGENGVTGEVAIPGSLATLTNPGGNSGRGFGKPEYNNLSNGDGSAASGFGAGGSSGRNRIGGQVARSGGDGADGIVIVELYA